MGQLVRSLGREKEFDFIPPAERDRVGEVKQRTLMEKQELSERAVGTLKNKQEEEKGKIEDYPIHQIDR